MQTYSKRAGRCRFSWRRGSKSPKKQEADEGETLLHNPGVKSWRRSSMLSWAKLVRDRIPETMREQGKDFQLRVLAKDELQAALMAKFAEECQEVYESPTNEDLVEELADVCEVLEAVSSIEEGVLDGSEPRQHLLPNLHAHATSCSLQDAKAALAQMAAQVLAGSDWHAFVAEYAKIKLLMASLIDASGLDIESIEAKRIHKKQVRGGFHHGMFVSVAT